MADIHDLVFIDPVTFAPVCPESKLQRVFKRAWIWYNTIWLEMTRAENDGLAFLPFLDESQWGNWDNLREGWPMWGPQPFPGPQESFEEIWLHKANPLWFATRAFWAVAFIIEQPHVIPDANGRWPVTPLQIHGYYIGVGFDEPTAQWCAGFIQWLLFGMYRTGVARMLSQILCLDGRVRGVST